NPVKAAVVTEDYGMIAPSSLINLLEANTFTIDEIKLSTLESIPEDYDFLILNAPLYDLTNNDLNKIDKWLDNGGSLGKNLFYSAAATADVLPNLNAFLQEWGISLESGYVYQTNANYGYQMSPTYQQLELKSGDYSDGVDTGTKASYGDGLKAVTRLFDESGSYKTQAIVSTYDGAVIAPYDGLQDFDPSAAGQSGSYDIIAESNKVVFEGVNGTYSRVYALGSELFLESAFLESQYANNSDIVLNIFTKAAGKDKVEVDVTPQTYSVPAMEITGAQMRGITVVFAVVVPLLVIAVGVVIIIRRKRR
ncbi:MAG: GldG family protein, partial [[Eubacterium] siraeum]|nr:GldG family protein [[Eubacterium] siraeum]